MGCTRQLNYAKMSLQSLLTQRTAGEDHMELAKTVSPFTNVFSCWHKILLQLWMYFTITSANCLIYNDNVKKHNIKWGVWNKSFVLKVCISLCSSISCRVLCGYLQQPMGKRCTLRTGQQSIAGQIIMHAHTPTYR